jgi:hypothetical protein
MNPDKKTAINNKLKEEEKWNDPCGHVTRAHKHVRHVMRLQIEYVSYQF